MQIVVPDEFKYLYVHDEEHPIVKVPSDVLLQTAKEVERVTKRHQLIADNMAHIMREARGIGLAAPQIGVLDRLIIVAPEGTPIFIFNPVVLKVTGSQIAEEGCLSIPGFYGDVERAAFVEVAGLDRKGRESTWEMEEIGARVLLHEMDHLDGILFTEKVDVSTVYWQHPSQQATGAE